jgi:hypothetical protein
VPDRGKVVIGTSPTAAASSELPAIAAIKCPHCEELLTETEVRSILGQYARSERFGRIRGNRFAKLTPEQRREESRKAGLACWAKRRTESSAPPRDNASSAESSSTANRISA